MKIFGLNQSAFNTREAYIVFDEKFVRKTVFLLEFSTYFFGYIWNKTVSGRQVLD
jgi:hypothetical protein